LLDWFAVEHLNAERLLLEWRWLCPQPLTLVARSAFADLILRDESGKVFRLNVTIGSFRQIAGSEAEFREAAKSEARREEWFAESDEHAKAAKGLAPNADQCVGFAIPIVFTESRADNTAYLIDIYEGVSFLGDLHPQISGLPDGSKVRLITRP
jgi:hypothetical protein